MLQSKLYSVLCTLIKQDKPYLQLKPIIERIYVFDTVYQGYTVLMLALMHSNCSILKKHLLLLVNNEPYNRHGFNYLSLAILYKNPLDITLDILNKTYDINHVNNNGYNAFMLALKYSEHFALKTELMTRSSLYQVNVSGHNALMLSIIYDNHEDITLYLIRNTKNLDRCDARGNTALMLALRYSKSGTIKRTLLNKTDNIYQVNKNGLNIIDICVKYGNSNELKSKILHKFSNFWY